MQTMSGFANRVRDEVQVFVGVAFVECNHEYVFQCRVGAFVVLSAVVNSFWSSQSEWPATGAERHLVTNDLAFEGRFLDVTWGTCDPFFSQ